MEMQMNLTLPPPEEDSEDLTDEEIQRAIETQNEDDMAKLIARELSPGVASLGKADARYALHRQELRRRRPHLYNRVSLCCAGEPDKVLVYRVDWLQRGQEYEHRE
jgi:hypothetical protein